MQQSRLIVTTLNMGGSGCRASGTRGAIQNTLLFLAGLVAMLGIVIGCQAPMTSPPAPDPEPPEAALTLQATWISTETWTEDDGTIMSGAQVLTPWVWRRNPDAWTQSSTLTLNADGTFESAGVGGNMDHRVLAGDYVYDAATQGGNPVEHDWDGYAA